MHILLADDHTLVREMLREYLQKLYSDSTIIEAATYDEALESANCADSLDLILLDFIMPGMRGGGKYR